MENRIEGLTDAISLSSTALGGQRQRLIIINQLQLKL